MKKIEMWETQDGRKFDSQLDAEKYESTLLTATEWMARLCTPPKNQNLYVDPFHHDMEVVKKVRAGIVGLAKSEGYACLLDVEDFSKADPNGILGRYLDDSNSPLCAACYRLCCIDSHGREWDQIYTAMTHQ